MELTRFRGHLTLWGGGIHYAEIETAVPASSGTSLPSRNAASNALRCPSHCPPNAFGNRSSELFEGVICPNPLPLLRRHVRHHRALPAASVQCAMHSHRARRTRVRRVTAQHPAVPTPLYLDERQVHIQTRQRLSHHLALGFGKLRIPVQSDHRIRRKVVSDSGGRVITFAGCTALVQGV